MNRHVTARDRAPFSEAQMLQANFIGLVDDEDRRQRRASITHPIDNVAPEIASDRDDGIFVEAEEKNGGYRVHVTIADVATHIAPQSPLGQAAWQRAFTLYGPGWTDPMFPKILESRLSLEHQQERLGMEIIIELDTNFQPIHTEFEPVITHASSTSYAQAEERMQSDPQYQLMQKIAQGLRQHYFNPEGLAWSELQYGNGPRDGKNQSAMKLVETYMILANGAVADFAHAANMPFLYRNFMENSIRAYYSPVPERHSALEKIGVKGKYCHFTSPIRRAPDFFNGHQIHYAVERVQGICQSLAAADPSLDGKALRHDVWQHAPALLRAAERARGHLGVRAKTEINTTLKQIVGAHGRSLTPELKRAISHCRDELIAHAPPLARETLQHYADTINRLARSDEVRQVARLNDKYEDGLRELQGLSEGWMHHRDPNKISSLLEKAATCNYLPDVLVDEFFRRLKNGKLNTTQDFYTILIQADAHNREWLPLKKAVIREMKHHPSDVHNLIHRFYDRNPGQLKEVATDFPSEPLSGEARPRHVTTAVMVLENEGQPTVSAPFYSVDHRKARAIAHAHYSFLEHYGFGQLQPVEQLAMPNLLYAELSGEAKRSELIRRMVQGVGGDFQLKIRYHGDRVHVSAKVMSAVLPQPIYTSAQNDNEDKAVSKAISRMLRNSSFQYLVSDAPPMEAILHPEELLRKLVEDRGGEVEIPRPAAHRQGFKATVTALLNDKIVTTEGTAPNMDRATRIAAVKALNHFGWAVHRPPQTQSWVTEEIRRRTPRHDYAGNGKA